jgi:hypothetical protein
MSTRSERIEIIKEIEKKRGTRLICYLTSDRRNLEGRIAKDVHPFIYEHLLKFGTVPKIDLLLHTNGGDTLAGFSIVKKIREFCKEHFSVLVPVKALSCGTLICLGADSVLMTKMGTLSPIDPSVTSEYNPIAQPNIPQLPGVMAGMPLPLNVEDVAAYLKLAKEEAKINDLEKVFLRLSESVNPIALGRVYRAREQIKMLGKQLLSTRKRSMDSTEKEEIVNYLSRELGSHDYEISLTEAKEKLRNIDEADVELTKNLWTLYGKYRDLMELDTTFTAETVLGTNPVVTYDATIAVLESTDIYHRFKQTMEIKRVRQQLPQGIAEGIQARGIDARWIEERS